MSEPPDPATEPHVPPPTAPDVPPAPPSATAPDVPPAPPPADAPTSDLPFQPAPPPAAGYGYGQVVPGAAPPGMYLDVASGLTLPEGVALASVARRIGAYFLAIPLAIVTLVIGYVIWGLIVWGRGQTPAFQVLGMRCWRPEQRQTARWGWMALREVIGRWIDSIALGGLISFILMITGRERRTIHDYIAGTVVLHDPDRVLAG